MACGGRGTRRARCASEPLAPGARDVFAAAGVDADHFALVDEQRHAHHRAGLDLGGLLATGGGVPTPSLSHCAFSPTADLPAVYCSKLSGTMKCQKSPSW